MAAVCKKEEGMSTKTYRRILHPTDLSESSRFAFAHALKIAICATGQRRAALEILHCNLGSKKKPFEEFPKVRQRLIRWGVLPEQASKRDVVDLGLNVLKQLNWGEPEAEIARESEEHEADLLVMTSHARGGWSHSLQASVSSSAIQRSQIPGLLLPGNEPGFVQFGTGTVELQKIMVPVAPTPEPWPALQEAARLLFSLGKECPAAGELYQVFVGAEDQFPHSTEPPLPPGWSWKKETLSGQPVEALQLWATQFKPDLTVMASQGRKTWRDRWFGSTLEYLLGSLKSPILVAPTE